jgi:phosphoribosylamine--glycine ligase
LKVLLLGSGGREHALAWKIARSPQVARVIAAPGSDGMARVAQCAPDVQAGDADAVLALARRERVDLVVVGPEHPLAAGIADRLAGAGLAVFGPSAAAARLEASKSFAKEFMQRHAIPTAAFASFDALDAARAHVRSRGGPCVVKADGLAAGKGVFVCDGPADAERALVEIMGERRFGASGARVVVEERLVGGRSPTTRSPTARTCFRSPRRRTRSGRSTATAARTRAAWAPTRRRPSSRPRSRSACSRRSCTR